MLGSDDLGGYLAECLVGGRPDLSLEAPGVVVDHQCHVRHCLGHIPVEAHDAGVIQGGQPHRTTHEQAIGAELAEPATPSRSYRGY